MVFKILPNTHWLSFFFEVDRLVQYFNCTGRHNNSTFLASGLLLIIRALF